MNGVLRLPPSFMARIARQWQENGGTNTITGHLTIPQPRASPDEAGFFVESLAFYPYQGSPSIGSEWFDALIPQLRYVCWERLRSGADGERWLWQRLPPFRACVYTPPASATINPTTRERSLIAGSPLPIEVYIAPPDATRDALLAGERVARAASGLVRTVLAAGGTIDDGPLRYRVALCEPYGPWQRLSLELVHA